MFHDHQHVEDSKGGACYDEEVAGDDGRRVILEKGRPTLITARVAGRCDGDLGQIFPDGTRRHAQAEFHQQLVGNSLLAPGRILAPSQMLNRLTRKNPASKDRANNLASRFQRRDWTHASIVAYQPPSTR